MDQIHVIQHKHLVEGIGDRRIARGIGLSRNTACKYLAGEGEPVRDGADRSDPVRVVEQDDEEAADQGEPGAQAANGGRLHGWDYDGVRVPCGAAETAAGGLRAVAVGARRLRASRLVRGDCGGRWGTAEGVEVPIAADVLGTGLRLAVRSM
jgi:hypothetical protein